MYDERVCECECVFSSYAQTSSEHSDVATGVGHVKPCLQLGQTGMVERVLLGNRYLLIAIKREWNMLNTSILPPSMSLSHTCSIEHPLMMSRDVM